MAWVCGTCDSPVTLKRVERNVINGRMARQFDVMPAHCSNPECKFFDERRLTFGWAKYIEDQGPASA